MTNSDTEETQKLPAEIYRIEKKLEEIRLAALNKTKGLFKRVFLWSWGSLFTFFLLEFSAEDGFNMFDTVGAVLISLVLSSAGAGIYTLIRKISYNWKFKAVFKKVFIPKIIAFVNPNLAYSDNGNPHKEFNEADLFGSKSMNYIPSYDRIEGTIDGAKIIFSERLSYAHSKHIDLGGSFNGPLIHIEMKHINMSTRLKIFPSNTLRPFRERRKNYKGHHKGSPRIDIKYNDEDRVLTDITSIHPNYEFYCKSEDEARSFMTQQVLKFVAFFYAKYGDKNIFISFNQNKCYIALAEIDKKNLFDTDTYLKNNIIDSQFANQIHHDAQLVNQLMKEITLINAI